MSEATSSTYVRLATRLSKQGSHLLHAQCWAWGQDIKHAEGNLLLRYGFERVRPPEPISGCSQYTCRYKQLTIRVWGFGIYAGQTEGMFLNRYEFVPRRAVLTDAWQPAQVGQGRRFYDAGLLVTFLEWLCDYETWVEETAGRAYRQSVVSGFGKHLQGPFDLLVEWLRFKERVERAALDDTSSRFLSGQRDLLYANATSAQSEDVCRTS